MIIVVEVQSIDDDVNDLECKGWIRNFESVSGAIRVLIGCEHAEKIIASDHRTRAIP